MLIEGSFTLTTIIQETKDGTNWDLALIPKGFKERRNRATVDQGGDRNESSLIQTGASGSAIVDQSGNDNDSLINQGGANNVANVTQSSDGNSSIVNLGGTGNTATVTQGS